MIYGNGITAIADKYIFHRAAEFLQGSTGANITAAHKSTFRGKGKHRASFRLIFASF